MNYFLNLGTNYEVPFLKKEWFRHLKENDRVYLRLACRSRGTCGQRICMIKTEEMFFVLKLSRSGYIINIASANKRLSIKVEALISRCYTTFRVCI